MEVVLVGNPVMHHLFLGIDPTELGGAPFALATGLAVTMSGARAGPEAQSRRLGLCAALHRGACRRRHGGRGTVGGAARAGRDHAGRRCRHQCRDRAGLEGAAAGLFLAHGTGLRRRADLVGPARGARRHRAHPHRSRDAGAALQGDRLRSLVGRTGLRGGGRADRRHRHLRLGHHRGHRGNVSRRHHQPGRRGRRLAGGAQPAHRVLQAHLQLCHPAAARGRQRAADPRDAERRARHPARPRPRSMPASGC